MRSRHLRTVALFTLSWIAAGVAQSPRPRQSPLDCLNAVRERAAARQKALTPFTAEGVRQILDERAAGAKACAATFDVAAVAEADLVALIDLAAEAGQPELADAAVRRALASTTLGDDARAWVLVQAIRTGLRTPKSAARNARLEGFVSELDRMSDAVLVQKLGAHQSMNAYYRGDDIDDGIIRHSSWIIERAGAFTPAQRTQYGASVLTAYVNLAETWAGHGRTDAALALLERAKIDWAEVPRVAERLDPTLDRYRLVGTPAPAIVGSRWLNVPDGTRRLEMTGAVTLLEFTAHWCGPCKESYPGVKRLLAKFGPRGFRVVFATELYGYFGTERNLPPDAELERDRDYFRAEGLDVPIAVDERPAPDPGGGRPVYVPSANDAAYRVGAIPQIHLIDRKGVIRLIMVGYDEANEPRLAALIEQLLKES
jgi:thiol-disulfide isomerase/thioredoxin